MLMFSAGSIRVTLLVEEYRATIEATNLKCSSGRRVNSPMAFNICGAWLIFLTFSLCPSIKRS
ncbi:hypothetical protein XBP1_2360040 [Xenorhabdus bovienii str. puntauvense]|uniref:Uncharacterized protein n=1 Tax=Xenorhabdus bovienii str. puntauvense TaxID=1398201 RepID=A0A077NGF1_XENBV|nr:hypothetical protein XBFFL1_2410017 [Xenorhabdus bovienii str. feltiae Florida]CDG96895.1 hypothetical protein XBP1_2360040 [Xenorhabdus bovienii str. puntauvense]